MRNASIISIICFVFIFNFHSQAQTVNSLNPGTEDEQVFTVVEEQPVFPGGMNEMARFIAKNLIYPASARRTGAMGRVFTGFIVEKDGSISDIKTIRGVSPDLDAEARRVVALMPNWKPGKQDGELVRCRFVLPINFNLTEPKKKRRRSE